MPKENGRCLSVFKEVFYSGQKRRAELLLVVNNFLRTELSGGGEYESQPRFGLQLDWIASAKISEGLPLTTKKRRYCHLSKT